jgi:hypothetical protein
MGRKFDNLSLMTTEDGSARFQDEGSRGATVSEITKHAYGAASDDDHDEIN